MAAANIELELSIVPRSSPVEISAPQSAQLELGPADQLETLRTEIPTLHTQLVSHPDAAPHLFIMHNRREERIVWDVHSHCYRWLPSGKEAGHPGATRDAASTIARIMGAPTRKASDPR